jgi:hypothetical protein
MKERPIIFTAPEVRAILACRKTMTRRVVKPQPYPNGFHFDGRDILCHIDDLPPSAMLMDVGRGKYRGPTSNLEGWEAHCPYGQPGERLWVRETFLHEPADYCWEASVSIPVRPAMTIYRADADPTGSGTAGWKSPIHMPRSLSRITLEIESVRVERLQDISEADALAEGVERIFPAWHPADTGPNHYTAEGPERVSLNQPTAAGAFRSLWTFINGEGSWTANPWVWVLAFKRVTP